MFCTTMDVCRSVWTGLVLTWCLQRMARLKLRAVMPKAETQALNVVKNCRRERAPVFETSCVSLISRTR